MYQGKMMLFKKHNIYHRCNVFVNVVGNSVSFCSYWSKYFYSVFLSDFGLHGNHSIPVLFSSGITVIPHLANIVLNTWIFLEAGTNSCAIIFFFFCIGTVTGCDEILAPTVQCFIKSDEWKLWQWREQNQAQMQAFENKSSQIYKNHQGANIYTRCWVVGSRAPGMGGK